MLPELHLALKNLLYAKGAIPRDEVDITFELPTREWLDSLARPTINLFLFEFEENTDLRQTAVQTGRTQDAKGRVVGIHRMPVRRFDMRYLVSAPNTITAHEHLLLWRILVTLLKYPQLPLDVIEMTVEMALRDAGFLKPKQELRIPRRDDSVTIADLRAFLADLEGVGRVRDGLATLVLEPGLSGQVAALKEGPRLHDLWGAFELPPRPAIIYTVTVPIDLNIVELSPLVDRVLTRYTGPGEHGLDPSLVSARDPKRGFAPVDGVRELASRERERGLVAGVVRDRRGRPVTGATLVADNTAVNAVHTDEEGRFTLRNVPQGDLRLRIVRAGLPPAPATLTIPSERYDIVLD